MLWADADDRDLTEWAIAETGNEVPVRFVADTEELETMVGTNGEPSLILLNDRGAVHNGREQLSNLKKHAKYSHIPVAVLGEYSTRDYIRDCYRAGANTFITKPSTIAATKNKVELFFRYWFEVAEV